MDNQDITPPHNNPEWCQIKETVLMLALAVAQIRVSMTDGTNSVGTLTDTFTEMAKNGQDLQHLLESLSTQNSEIDQLEDFTKITDHAKGINRQVGEATIAFQFYDRLCQRLSHVCESLQNLSGLIDQADRRFNPGEWQRLQHEIKSSYSMECERIMFEHILQGASIEEALEAYTHHFKKEDSADEYGDEIELF